MEKVVEYTEEMDNLEVHKRTICHNLIFVPYQPALYGQTTTTHDQLRDAVFYNKPVHNHSNNKASKKEGIDSTNNSNNNNNNQEEDDSEDENEVDVP